MSSLKKCARWKCACRGGDVILDPSPSDDGEDRFGPIAFLADATHEPTAMIESAQRDVMATEGIASAMSEPDDRSRRIVSERWLKVNDDGSGGMTLHELAAEYGVSVERVRQIEVAAMKKCAKRWRNSPELVAEA